MKNIRQFTIMELLVAIGITAVVINFLSTVYSRTTYIAVQQTSIASGYDESNAAIEKMMSDLNAFKPMPFGYAGTTTRDFKLRFNFTSGYPYLVFTKSHDESLDSVDGFEEAWYSVGPKLNETPNKIDDSLLCLYRAETTVVNDLINAGFVTNLTEENILMTDVIWMSANAQQNIYSGTSYDKILHHTDIDGALDTSLGFGTNSLDKIPHTLDLLITVVPKSGAFSFSVNSSVSASNAGTTVSIGTDEALSKDNSFSLTKEGHLANLTTGAIFYYVSTSSTTMKLYPAVGSASISVGNELITGIGITKRIELQ